MGGRERVVWGQAILSQGAKEQQGSCYTGRLTNADQEISDCLKVTLQGEAGTTIKSWSTVTEADDSTC